MLLFPQLGYSAKPRSRASNLPNLISHCVTNNEPKLCLPLYKGFASVRILPYRSERCPPNGVFCVGALGTGSIKYAEALCRSLSLSSESFFQVFSFNSKKTKKEAPPLPLPKSCARPVDGRSPGGAAPASSSTCCKTYVFRTALLKSVFQVFLPNLSSKSFFQVFSIPRSQERSPSPTPPQGLRSAS